MNRYFTNKECKEAVPQLFTAVLLIALIMFCFYTYQRGKESERVRLENIREKKNLELEKLKLEIEILKKQGKEKSDPTANQVEVKFYNPDAAPNGKSDLVAKL